MMPKIIGTHSPDVVRQRKLFQKEKKKSHPVISNTITKEMVRKTVIGMEEST